ncbi:MAG: exodeoxyribonuclease VII small subunit [Saccharofermentans sp.]|nr:exodeoxyribonuclease VII small subunit [Saccharofermentans sp.]
MPENELTYENAVSELRDIVKQLNEGKASLDDSIKLYNRGIELSKFCSAKLDEAEQKILIYNKDQELTEPFDVE